MEEGCLEGIREKREAHNHQSPDYNIKDNIDKKYNHADGLETSELIRDWVPWVSPHILL